LARLRGKVCVVTGAASGIGAETAQLFMDEGATVVGVDLRDDGTGTMSLAADVSDEQQVSDLYDRVRSELGRLDVLFNNAGISPTDDASVLETSVEAWQPVQDVNLKSVFLCCKHGIPHLIENGGGSVVNTASFVATMGSATSQISYTASKGGVLALSRELGVEFARQGVRVNALCPGRSTRRCCKSCSRRTPSRPRGGSCTCRRAASPRCARSPTPRCSSPATSRAT
jgi:NAD(P)-dependent dehydrogenase (short-subunit alcohol dehydrogenase family)